MSAADSVDRKVGEAARALPSEPIRWEAVRRLARRRRRLRALRLLGLVALIALALAGAVVAAKAFLDPTYSPPIFSPATVNGSAEISGAGLVPRSELAGHGYMGVTRRGGLGYVVRAEVQTRGLNGARLTPRWRLREAGSRAAPRFGPAEGSVPLTIHGQSEGRTIAGWLPAPPESGRYVVEMQIEDSGKRAVETLRSDPAPLIGSRWGQAYETASYEAKLPRGWQLKSDYQLASPNRYLSTATGPGGASITIDTTLAVDGDPWASQGALEAQMRAGGARYRRLRVAQRTDRGDDVVEWSYVIDGRRYTDVLFYRGGSGFGILGVSSSAGFQQTRDLCRLVARSIRTKGLG